MIRPLPTLGCAFLAACGASPAPAPAPTATATTAPTPRATPTPLQIPQPSGNAAAVAAFQRVEDRWVPVLYLCDGVAGDRVAVVTAPDAAGAATLWTYAKPGFATTRTAVTLGAQDAGMSHVWRELLPAGGGAALGTVSEVSPGVYGDGHVTTLPTLSSMRIGETGTRCRWLPGARVLLVTSRRSVVVAADPERGGYIYRSFDHDRPGRIVDDPGAASSTPTTEVRGGRLVSAADGREVYEFSKAPWTYRVTASARADAPGASVAVLRDRRTIETQTAAVYEMAAKRIE